MSDEDKKLNTIVNEYAEAKKRLDPFYAPRYEVEADLDKFGDYPSADYFAREKNLFSSTLEKVRGIEIGSLSPPMAATYRLFKEDLDVRLAGHNFPRPYLEFNQMDNRLVHFIEDANPAISSFPFDSFVHYQAFLKRASGFPAYIDRQIELLKKGIKEKITLNCVVAEKTVNTYRPALETDVEKNPFWKPIKAIPEKFNSKERERLKSAFAGMIKEKILPNVKKFDQFFQKEYRPHCRQEFGIASLPQGQQWYSWAIRRNTNTQQDPKVLHQIGLNEVKRIEDEMGEVQKKLGIKGTQQEFYKTVLGRAEYFFKNEKDLIAAFEKARTAVAEKLPAYFELLPKTNFEIVRSDNPEDAAGVYKDPTDMKPIGRFIYNAGQLRRIPVYEVTTLLMHETNPGHHLQLALAYEMKDKLTEYRRKIFSSSAFAEGWALYSEYLGREMGLFKDPVQKFGHLNDELLRAIRLVVDTGIHSMGWDHDKTVAYMKEHLATDEADIETEANRYAVLPGQALSYKVGQLKMIELRKLAEKELGQKFNIKEFHAQVLGEGTVSLSFLEDQIKSWISTKKQKLATEKI